MLADRLQHLLASPDGHIPAELQPLRESLAQADRTRGILLWLRRSPNAALFTSLATAGEPITHQWLGQFPPSPHFHYVRHTLVRLSHDFLRSVVKSDFLFGSGDHRGVGILVGGAELLVV